MQWSINTIRNLKLAFMLSISSTMCKIQTICFMEEISLYIFSNVWKCEGGMKQGKVMDIDHKEQGGHGHK